MSVAETWEEKQIKAIQDVANEWGLSADAIKQAFAQSDLTLEEFLAGVDAFATDVTERVHGMVNGFELIPTKFDMSAQKMLDNLIANKETYAQWETTMEEITKQLGPTAAAEFSSLGPSATGAMQDILNSADMLQQYMDVFGVQIDEATGYAIEKWNDPNFIGAANNAVNVSAEEVQNNTAIGEAMKSTMSNPEAAEQAAAETAGAYTTAMANEIASVKSVYKEIGELITATAYIEDYKDDSEDNQQLEVNAKVQSIGEALSLV